MDEWHGKARQSLESEKQRTGPGLMERDGQVGDSITRGSETGALLLAVATAGLVRRLVGPRRDFTVVHRGGQGAVLGRVARRRQPLQRDEQKKKQRGECGADV